MSTLAKINKNSILNLKDLSLKLNLLEDEWNAFGKHVAKIDFEKVLKRTNIRKAKFIVVTGMTPTKFGEGKTTTTIGLVQGLGKLNKQVTGAIRQPSSGPTFNLKGSGGGGGALNEIRHADAREGRVHAARCGSRADVRLRADRL